MRLLLRILLCGLLFSCQSNPSVKQNDFRNLSDTTKNIDGITEHELYQQLDDAFLLPKIDNGVDSFELRIWSLSAMTDPDLLTVVRYQDSTWYSSQTIYWKRQRENINGPFLIDSLKTNWFTPPISYQNLVDSLLKYRLDTIPTQHLTPNFDDRTADGTKYTIELATKHFYTILVYRNPRFYQELNHQKINAFLKFCSSNLGVWYYQGG